MSARFDVAVVGAGAAGMMCAAVAAQRGLKVALFDHAAKRAEKIRISGGGRCNFTNLDTAPEHFISQNPHFARSALARYTPRDFVALVQRYRIGFHEKHRGQLFCDESSEDIIRMLVAECDQGGVTWRAPCTIHDIAQDAAGFSLATDAGVMRTQKLVIATGGLSIPKIGATDFGYRIARQFGLRIIETRPALVPLTFAPATWEAFSALAGVALQARVRQERYTTFFVEDLLFTHRGLSGPAILQISSYWDPGLALTLDLAPAIALGEELIARKATSKQSLANVMLEWFPKSLVEGWLREGSPGFGTAAATRIADVPDRTLRALGASLQQWSIVPSGTEGFKKAEVTRGGVDTDELLQHSLESKKVPGLHFIGEVVDVTGWLGGYNFQWAWASGVAAGRAL